MPTDRRGLWRQLILGFFEPRANQAVLDLKVSSRDAAELTGL